MWPLFQLLWRDFILGIFFEQTGGSPGSCNSCSGQWQWGTADGAPSKADWLIFKFGPRILQADKAGGVNHFISDTVFSVLSISLEWNTVETRGQQKKMH